MSTFKRAYDISRGYVNREWDRIHSIIEQKAEAELNEALDSPVPARSSAQAAPAQEPIGSTDRARQVLGVAQDADFDAIQKAFEKLMQRSNPANFPAGSAEATQAADIQRRIQQAYALLTDGMDATERRFRSLDIE